MSSSIPAETAADLVCPAPSGRATQAYLDAVECGRQRAAGATAVICALARSVALTLPRMQAQIAALAALFGETHLVICENDSNDSTRSDLMSWRPPVASYWLVGKDWDDPIWPRRRDMARAERMAFYRGFCQNTVLAHCPQVEYVMTVDFDLASVSSRGVLHTFAQPDWDAVGSNGLSKIRNKLVQFDAWAWRDFGSDRPLSWHEVHPRVFSLGQPMLQVNSCFGGMAIYRMEAYKVGVYTGGDCEHVGFHRTMREAGYGRIYLNPSQTVLY